MPVKVIVLNNNELGKISKEQRAGGWDKWATDLVNPDFAAFATSCGGLGLKVTQKAELEQAMQQLFEHGGPALLEICADAKLI
jgi:thiamine pyrophosphate-dependent acetolactate synthase large subunit-like protein